MNLSSDLDKVLSEIGIQYKDNISADARHYMEVNIGRKAEKMGLVEASRRFVDAYAIVPLKRPVPGMKVRIDGRTFVNYAQYPSGVAVPGYVARETGMPHRSYIPQDSMILNFA